MTTDFDGRMVSGEAVELDIRYARLGSRALALMIDIPAQVLLFVILYLTLGQLLTIAYFTSFGDDALASAFFVVMIAAVLIGYPVVFETLTRGRTLGKLALGLRVVRDDGGPVRFRHSLTRALVGVALEWPGLVLPLVTWVCGISAMLLSPKGKRLGDLAAGTVVIHDRSPASWGWVPGMPGNLAGWAMLLDLTGLDDDLALQVRHYLSRNRYFSEPFRTRLGVDLATEVAAKVTPLPPRGTPGWAYLAAVLAERHRRAVHRLVVTRSSTALMYPGLGAQDRLG